MQFALTVLPKLINARGRAKILMIVNRKRAVNQKSFMIYVVDSKRSVTVYFM